MEFDGVVAFDMNIDEAGFRAIAAREGWISPERLNLRFPSPSNPRSVDSALAPMVRVLARSDRQPAFVHQAAQSGRIILRDGCFRLSEHGDAGEPLVLFGRDTELRLDPENRMILADGPGDPVRLGERIVWAGPRGVEETDAGVRALREACGSDPIVGIGEPQSASRFPTFR